MKLIELRAHVRHTIADADTYPTDRIDAWIAEAIAFYSTDFPRRLRHTLTLTTGTQAYTLPAAHDITGILAVEYPSGQWPPTILSRADEWQNDFQNGQPVYALRPPLNTALAESDVAAGQIVFAETVATGEYAIIDYTTIHNIPTVGDDDAVITVQWPHMEAIFAYVTFRALVQLQVAEAITVSNVSIVLAQLGDEANQAWRHYRQVIDRLGYAQGGTSAPASWSDGLDARITF